MPAKTPVALLLGPREKPTTTPVSNRGSGGFEESKLDSHQRDFVVERILAGDDNASVVSEIKKRHGIVITRQAVAHYRKSQVVIGKLSRTDTEIFQSGYASRVKRVECHKRVVKALLNRLFPDEVSEDFNTDLIPQDIRSLVGELRLEMREVGRLVGESPGPVSITQNNVQVNNSSTATSNTAIVLQGGTVGEDDLLALIARRASAGESMDDIASSLITLPSDDTILEGDFIDTDEELAD